MDADSDDAVPKQQHAPHASPSKVYPSLPDAAAVSVTTAASSERGQRRSVVSLRYIHSDVLTDLTAPSLDPAATIAASTEVHDSLTARSIGHTPHQSQAHSESPSQYEERQRPAIAKRRSEQLSQRDVMRSTAPRKRSANPSSSSSMDHRGSVQRSIANAEDSFREVNRRRKSSVVMTANSPREESSGVPHGDPSGVQVRASSFCSIL